MKLHLLIEEGGRSLHGNYELSPDLVASQWLLVAALLSSGEVRLTNIPESEILDKLIDTVRFLGGTVEKKSDHLVVYPSDLTTLAIPSGIMGGSDLAFVLLGLMLGKYGEGAVEANRKYPSIPSLGINMHRRSGFVVANLDDARVGETVTYKVKTTSQAELLGLVLISVLRDGQKTVLTNVRAICPRLRTVIEMLISMGASIVNAPDGSIEIDGRKALTGTRFEVSPNINEVPIIASVVALCGGEIEIAHVDNKDLISFFSKLDQAGVSYKIENGVFRVWMRRGDPIAPIQVKLGNYPEFLEEWAEPLCVLMTQANGESSITDTLTKTGIEFGGVLSQVGAETMVFGPTDEDAMSTRLARDLKSVNQPHEAIVNGLKIFGPTKLQGKEFDLHGSGRVVALVAGLAAEGFSEIKNFEAVQNRYPNMVRQLIHIGAKLKIVEV